MASNDGKRGRSDSTDIDIVSKRIRPDTDVGSPLFDLPWQAISSDSDLDPSMINQPYRPKYSLEAINIFERYVYDVSKGIAKISRQGDSHPFKCTYAECNKVRRQVCSVLR